VAFGVAFGEALGEVLELGEFLGELMDNIMADAILRIPCPWLVPAFILFILDFVQYVVGGSSPRTDSSTFRFPLKRDHRNFIAWSIV